MPILSAISDALQHRLDDPSFWNLIAATISSFLIYKVSSVRSCSVLHFRNQEERYPIGMGWFGLLAWITMSAAGCYAYLAETRRAKEGLFTSPHNVSQILEGSLNLAAMVVAYFFVALCYSTITKARNAALREGMDCRQRCYSPSWVMHAALVPIWLFVVLWLVHKLGVPKFLNDELGWKFAPYQSTTQQLIIGFVVICWAPIWLALAFGIICWAGDLSLVRTQTLKFIPPFIPAFCECECKDQTKRTPANRNEE
jgi:hypothetical protein